MEFCVERGWIARGNRPGTYTLPKPPPRHGPTSGPADGAREEKDLGSSEQGGMPTAAAATAAREGFPEGARDTDTAPPGTAEAAARRGRGATGTTGTLWVGEGAAGGGGGGGGRARGGGTGGGGGGGNGGSGNAARPPARQPRVPLVPPGQQREYLLTAAAAAAVAEAEAEAVPHPQAVRRTPSASLSPPFRASGGGGQAAQTPAPSSLSPSMPTPTPSEQQQRLARGAAAGAAAAAATATAAAAEVDANITEAQALFSLNLDETRPPQKTAHHATAHLRSPPGVEPGTLPAAGGAQQLYHPFGQAPDNGRIPGGPDRGPSSEGEAAAAAAAAGTVDLGGNAIPESVLGVVLAGLEPADGESAHLCKYCCATLAPTAPECGVCGTTAAVAVAGAADSAAAAGGGVTDAGTVPACRWRAYYMAEDGRPYYSDGTSSVWVKPKELEEYEAAVAVAAAAATTAGSATQGGQVAATEPHALGDASFPPVAPSATTAAVPAAIEGAEEEGDTTAAVAGLETAEGGPAAGAALPAGVLAVRDLAEVCVQPSS